MIKQTWTIGGGYGVPSIKITKKSLENTSYKKVSDLESLVAMLAEGGDIMLDNDIETESMLNITTETTINLNGHKLSKSTTTQSGKCVLFYVNGDGAKLTIDGEGDVEVTSGKTDIAVWASENTEVTINSGNFHGVGCSTSSDLIYAMKGKITINGGTFKLDNPNEEDYAEVNYALLNAYGANVENAQEFIQVTGGKFYNFNPANNVSEGVGTNFVAEGYESVEVEEGVWEVA